MEISLCCKGRCYSSAELQCEAREKTSTKFLEKVKNDDLLTYGVTTVVDKLGRWPTVNQSTRPLTHQKKKSTSPLCNLIYYFFQLLN